MKEIEKKKKENAFPLGRVQTGNFISLWREIFNFFIAQFFVYRFDVITFTSGEKN